MFAPVSVTIPAGATGLDPNQTQFFQTLGVATKIFKGQIDIINAYKVIEQGSKVEPSQVQLLQKLGIRPFT